MQMSKSDFARHRGVSPAAVSQWISSGRLSGAALVGEGRTAKVDVAEADRQLATTLDLGQQMAQQTLRPALPVAAAPLLPRSPEDDHAARYQKARADSAEIDADRARRREQAERGLYMETDPARAAWGKELGGLLTAIDQWISDLAPALAAEPSRDPKVLAVVLRRRWREFRQKQADQARATRTATPALTHELGDAAGEGDPAGISDEEGGV
ncbi:hypothetical protein ACIU1J_01885 [Azospirillum doebereinerae]|uniref:hypothetical protein n=1 Tax=Azospirillum doebereinerae TaxID=92933 RepID=UPI001EE4FC85|nr:hypothetical protein [Azospirillum doebereinerae]MCG5240082.1 hypothetical protein [Azospirillum doebereinerae]